MRQLIEAIRSRGSISSLDSLGSRLSGEDAEDGSEVVPESAKGTGEPEVAEGTDEGFASEDGSAVVEFIFLGVLLIVPLIYFILTISQVQAAAFATTNATQGALTAMSRAESEPQGRERAEAMKRFAYEDFGLNPDSGSMQIECSAQCLSPGSKVSVAISFTVELPLFSNFFGSQLKVVELSDSATAFIPRYR